MPVQLHRLFLIHFLIHYRRQSMDTIETLQTVDTTTIRIPVRKLAISPLNVRKKQGSGIEELTALIASQGLIHNLVVVEQTKKGRKTGKYEVVAGGRRLAALKLLVSDGRLSKDHQVDCRLVEIGSAQV